MVTTLSTRDIVDIHKEIESTKEQIMLAEGVLNSLRQLKEVQESLLGRIQDINALRTEINEMDAGKEKA